MSQFLFARLYEKICPTFMWQIHLLKNLRAFFLWQIKIVTCDSLIVCMTRHRKCGTIERRLCPRPNPPSSLTFPSFFYLVNNKICSDSRYHSCLPSTNRRHLCNTFRSRLVIEHVSAPLVRVISSANGLTPIKHIICCAMHTCKYICYRKIVR